MFQFPWYASSCLCIQHAGTWLLHHVGFPIRTSPDQSLLTAPRGHIVVRHVLLRLLVPRHPPCALYNLTTRSCLETLRSQHTRLRSFFGCVTSFRYPVFKEQFEGPAVCKANSRLRLQNRT